MSRLDTFKARKQELQASGIGAVEAHQIAWGEAMRDLHDAEQALLDQIEAAP
ncbi:hypothetical protein [Sphaerimonospora thailandensis]|uniref:Uncharacterized protein n=1 Tax=Sphaerimonospora thailandensis TaxID=795644 RepID=A0A8J3R8M3_9ACTN|nr:hypothetical protein [Sphaerimonospora thailandensis]GIH69414.1 hypothetical protein Mth01_16670 [Sphaerimonospora thailandensis]